MKPYSIARACLLNRFSEPEQNSMKAYVYYLVLEVLCVDLWVDGVWFKMSDGVLVTE